MKNIKFKIISSILCLTTLFSTAIHAEDKKPEKGTKETETTTETHITDLKKLPKQMKKFPAASDASIQYYSSLEDYGTIMIPGIQATHSLEDDKRSMCTMMSVQGLCVANNYLLISAYCHSHNHNSVIYVINKETKEFIKEIILPGKPHVGGIAYDTKRDEIWVCSKKSGVPELCVFSMFQLEQYDSSLEKPIGYLYRYSVPIIKNASYMTYHDDKIYVGTFTYDDQDCKILSFSLEKTPEEEENPSGRYFTYLDTKDTYKQIQGFAIDGNYMYFTRSLSTATSHMDVYDINTNKINQKNSYNIYDFPQKLEQIYFDGDYFYALFESGSNAYNTQGDVILDRVLIVNTNELLTHKK